MHVTVVYHVQCSNLIEMCLGKMLMGLYKNLWSTDFGHCEWADTSWISLVMWLRSNSGSEKWITPLWTFVDLQKLQITIQVW